MPPPWLEALRPGAQSAQPRGRKFPKLPENPAQKMMSDRRILFNRCCAIARKSRNPQFTFARGDGYFGPADANW
jgi:hypothetical protein